MTRERLEVGAVLDRKYKLLRRLGEGGMGVVFEAEHLKIGGRVAIKVLNERLVGRGDAVRRFVQEARATSTIGHPGIVPVIDLGGLEPGRQPYIVMDLLRGANLARLMVFYGPLNPETVACVLLDVLSALSAAHAQGIIHRDLKPDNIFVALEASDVVAKIVDFGVSKFIHDRTGMGLTQTGTVMGTPTYMAPEQARGDKHLDARVDVYAAGVIFYEALCGQPPFVSDNYNALLQQIIAAPIEPVRKRRSDVSPDLEAVVFCAMARDLGERYPSADAMAAALRDVFEPGDLRRARRGLFTAVDSLPADVPSWQQSENSTMSAPDGMEPARGTTESGDEEPTNLFLRPGSETEPAPPFPSLPSSDDADAVSGRFRTLPSLDDLVPSSDVPAVVSTAEPPAADDLDAPSGRISVGPDAAGLRARWLARRRSAPDLSAGRATFSPPMRTPDAGQPLPSKEARPAPPRPPPPAVPHPSPLAAPRPRPSPSGLASEPEPPAPAPATPEEDADDDAVLVLDLDEPPEGS